MSSTVFVNGVTLTAASFFQDIDNVVYQFLSGVAGTNTITATGPAGLGAYVAGLKFRFIPVNTNTGATTINITGTAALGARNIFSSGAALTGGELVSGIPVEIVDDGTRFHLITAANPRTTKRKTASQSVTSSTTLVSDTDLTFVIGANEEWQAKLELDLGTLLSTHGFKFSMAVPAGATVNTIATGIGNGVATIMQRTSTTNATTDITAANFGAAQDEKFDIAFWVLNGATPGSVTLQYAQSTSSGTSLTVRKGSWMTASRVA